MYYEYKPLRATKRNVEDFIAMNLGVDPYTLVFVKLEEPPTIWKHSCVATGVTLLNVVPLMFEDGTNIQFAVCPSCGKVIYYTDAPAQVYGY